MDPALLKEREAFKKRAINMPVVEKRKARPESSIPNKKPRPSKPSKPSESSKFNYKTSTGSSSNKFGVLAKIVNYMKQRHQQGDTHPLTVEEILDETNQLDVGSNTKHWLTTEALRSNPKLEMIEDDRYVFKPKYNIPSKKKLLKLLDKNDREGLGGILIDDVEESLPNCAKALKSLGDDIIYITRPDKKQILFYNDKSSAFTTDEEFQKLWRSVTVEGLDERKIEEHLKKHGISSMQDLGMKKTAPIRKKKANRKGASQLKKTHNEHMGDILQDYSTVNK